MVVTCEAFRDCEKNFLEGFADLIIEPVGVRLRECTLNRSGDSVWVGLPARPYEDEEGTKRWARLVDFSTRSGYYAFQQSAIEAIRDFRARVTK